MYFQSVASYKAQITPDPSDNCRDLEDKRSVAVHLMTGLIEGELAKVLVLNRMTGAYTYTH
jgi:hypothetical protein